MITSAVSDALSPILFSFFPFRKPGVPVSIANAEIPLFSRAGSVTANTIVRSPTEPWVVNVFEPFRIHPPPSLGTAFVFVPPASLPAVGSVKLHAPIQVPEASFGTYAFRCASLPHAKMWFVQSELCAATEIPIEPSTRESSSTTMTYST